MPALIHVEADLLSPDFIVLVDGKQVIGQYFENRHQAETYAASLRQASLVAAISPAVDGFDTTLNSAYVGTFPTEARAWQEAQAVATTEVRALEIPAANPLIPFGVDAGPAVDLSHLTPADVARATEAVIDFYEASQATSERTIRAYELALMALAEQHRAVEERTVRVRENGDLTIRGSKPYWISGHGCTCRDFGSLVYGKKYAGSGAEGGMCKHVLCRELLRLAQARQGVFNPDQGNKTAYAELGAGQLVRSLKALLKQEPEAITIAITFFQAQFRAGEVIKQLASDSRQGWGIRSLTLAADDAQRLVEALTPLAKTDSINLLLDAGEGEVSVFGSGIGFTAQAVPA
jgi:hypothetical protein